MTEYLFVVSVVFILLDDDVADLPDAVDEYALMVNLVMINVSNSNSLGRAPLGWAYIPNEKLVIDVHGSTQFYDLPFVLCSSHAKLTTLDMSGTVAETTMNWNGQLSAANFSSFGVDSLNDACVVALKKLTSLSLADNNLTSRYCFVKCRWCVVIVVLTLCSFEFFSLVKLTINCYRTSIH